LWFNADSTAVEIEMEKSLNTTTQSSSSSALLAQATHIKFSQERDMTQYESKSLSVGREFYSFVLFIPAYIVRAAAQLVR